MYKLSKLSTLNQQPTHATKPQFTPKPSVISPNTTILLKRTALVGCIGVALLGCSDDDDNTHASLAPPTTPIVISEAILIDDPVLVKSFSAAELKSALQTAGMSYAEDSVINEPICGITVYYMNHTTTGVKDEPTNATGAVITPSGDDEQCQGARPITLYAHGTRFNHAYNFAALDDPDSSDYANSLSIAASFVGQGDILIAPNYPGYDKSTLTYAPYVTAKQGKQMLDGLHAGKLTIDSINGKSGNKSNKKMTVASADVTYGDKLFITGYSQGGYVAMATAKALDELGAPATAVSPASGPYAVTAYADSIMAGNVIYGGTVFLPMMATSYQQEYEDTYPNVFAGAFHDKYDGALDLFPTKESIINIFFAQKLPLTQLFQASPTGYDVLESLSPPSPRFAFGFDDDNYLFNTDFRAKYVEDMQKYPDGIYPTFSEGKLAQTSDLAVRQMFIDNDLRDYTPSAPTLLCGGNQDPMVTFDVNASAQARIWTKNTNAQFALLDVDISNQDDRATQGLMPYHSTLPTAINSAIESQMTGIQQAFTTALNTSLGNAYQVAYAKAIEDGKSMTEATALGKQASYSSLLTEYHSMVAPYCAKAANGFFEEYR